jgi:predicted ArsR family transcriptional regulator
MASAPEDVLAQRTRSAIVRLLAEVQRPLGTDELAERLELHPNGIRLHLARLTTAGLVERRSVAGARGRPRYEWAIAPDAAHEHASTNAYRHLATWLARSTPGSDPTLDHVEQVGREIGDQIGVETGTDATARAPDDVLRTVLTSFGFQPAQTDEPNGQTRYTLRNCPYKDAATENQPVVCRLHRGITHGLLGRLAPSARLAAFVPTDPHRARCLIDVAWEAPPSPALPVTRLPSP